MHAKMASLKEDIRRETRILLLFVFKLDVGCRVIIIGALMIKEICSQLPP